MNGEIIDCYTPPGTKVIYSNPDYGYDYDKVQAAKHLVLNQVYTVSRIYVGGSHSSVVLKEIPKETFNTVMFGPLPDAKSAAVKTLEEMGYTYTEGAEYWKPPIEYPPLPDEDLDLYDEPTIYIPGEGWVKL